MKKLIGIVPASNDLFKTEFVYEDKYCISNNYITRIKESGGIPVGVLPQGVYIEDEDLEIYDGFVMIGGGKIHSYHIQVIDYVVRNNKPFLGICMGMQALAIYFLLCNEKERRNYSGNIINLYEELRKDKYNFTEAVEGHRNSRLKRDNIEEIKHEVKIKKESILYNLYGKEILNMPSIHRYKIPKVEKELKVTGMAEDGTIEVVEYNDKIFGVQFHPENESINNCMFKYIISKC